MCSISKSRLVYAQLILAVVFACAFAEAQVDPTSALLLGSEHESAEENALEAGRYQAPASQKKQALRKPSSLVDKTLMVISDSPPVQWRPPVGTQALAPRPKPNFGLAILAIPVEDYPIPPAAMSLDEGEKSIKRADRDDMSTRKRQND